MIPPRAILSAKLSKSMASRVDAVKGCNPNDGDEGLCQSRKRMRAPAPPEPRQEKPTLMQTTQKVYVVDADTALQDYVCRLLEANQIPVQSYLSAADLFLHTPVDAGGCLLLDLSQADGSGIDLQRRIAKTYPLLALVVTSANASVEMAVKVMESGAVTLLQKPFQSYSLLAAVKNAFARSQESTENFVRSAELRTALDTLTTDERRVLSFMLRGVSNKRIASELDISSRTLDRRRAAVMSKMRVASIAELAHLLYGTSYAEPPVLKDLGIAPLTPATQAQFALS
jgi:two-component system, LuxR family, response regulator FixJ